MFSWLQRCCMCHTDGPDSPDLGFWRKCVPRCCASPPVSGILFWGWDIGTSTEESSEGVTIRDGVLCSPPKLPSPLPLCPCTPSPSLDPSCSPVPRLLCFHWTLDLFSLSVLSSLITCRLYQTASFISLIPSHPNLQLSLVLSSGWSLIALSVVGLLSCTIHRPTKQWYWRALDYVPSACLLYLLRAICSI